MLRLIDVSSYQGSSVDWDALREQGIAGGLAKCTEGSGWADPTFSRNWDAIKSAQLLRGLYHFCRFDLGTTAQQEATWLLSHLPPLETGDVLILDAETPTSGPGAFDGAVLGMADLIERATKTTPWLYTGQWYAQGLGRLTSKELARLPLFNAAYGPHQPAPYAPWTGMVAWQHTDAMILSGISRCDESYFFGTADTFKVLGYPAPATPPAPSPELPHYRVTMAMHFRPRPQLDAMPLGPLLPVDTYVAAVQPPKGLPIETTHWLWARTGGNTMGYLYKPNLAVDKGHPGTPPRRRV